MLKRLLLCALLFTGCDPSIGHIYWLVGDSTSLSLLEQIVFFGSVRPAGDLVIPLATVPGYTLGLDNEYYVERMESAQLPQMGLGHPNAVVVLLGTNDMWKDTNYACIATDEQLDQAIDRFLGSMPPVPVLWVETSAPVLAEERRTRLQAALDRAQATHPQLHLLLPSPDVYGDQDVHFTDPGADEVSRQIVAELDRIEGRE